MVSAHYFILFFIISLLIAVFWAQMIRKVKETRAAEWEAISEKNLPKILYLRAFGTDGSGRDYEPSIALPFEFLKGEKFYTYENDLSEFFFNKAHLIAVGKPSEKLPELGFQRFYFSDEEWKDKVLQFMNESVMIIYRPDSSDGILWELEQIFLNNYKNKLLIWTQVGDSDEYILQKAQYNDFRRKVLNRYNEKFPEFKSSVKFLCYDNENKLIWNKNPVEYFEALLNKT